VDGIEQFLVAERLRQEINRAGFHRPHTYWNVAMTGDKDDGNPDTGIGQLALKIQTADSGKSDVKNQTWRVWANRPEHALDGSAHQWSSSTTNTVGGRVSFTITAPEA
jgi:hypothetical protein